LEYSSFELVNIRLGGQTYFGIKTFEQILNDVFFFTRNMNILNFFQQYLLETFGNLEHMISLGIINKLDL
jgi:hypothetical protein